MSKTYGAGLSRYKDPEKRLAWVKEWKRTHPRNVAESNARGNARIKKEALARYGKNGEHVCCWDRCTIDDLDMLTPDHVNNDGAQHRKQRGKGWTGADAYRKLSNLGWPPGFQTLCWNHQWKKEIARRRERAIARISKSVEAQANCPAACQPTGQLFV